MWLVRYSPGKYPIIDRVTVIRFKLVMLNVITGKVKFIN